MCLLGFLGTALFLHSNAIDGESVASAVVKNLILRIYKLIFLWFLKNRVVACQTPSGHHEPRVRALWGFYFLFNV